MIKVIVITLLLATALSKYEDDRINKQNPIPGYPANYSNAVYSGYLPIVKDVRQIHYLFMESDRGPNNNDPVTLWLNGGPGCSSLLGYLQEIGPFYLEDGANYKPGDNLTENKNAWTKISNLLFMESPAGVGFSFNTDSKFQYNDVQTAQDTFIALQQFYIKFPEYASRGLWLAGESYAGKYIPDLAQLIVQSNEQNKTSIKLKGMLIGNGIITFEYLSVSEIEFMINRNFVDPENLNYWRSSCQTDPESAGCQFFIKRYQEDVDEINPYNVYGYCYYNDSTTATKRVYESQYSILQKVKRQFQEKKREFGSVQNIDKLTFSSKDSELTEEQVLKIDEKLREDDDDTSYGSAPCAYFTGMSNYFNAHSKAYNAKWGENMKWNGPCAQNITYHLDPRGSYDAYIYLLSRETNRSQIVLYNGNWDVVVPYIDTVKNIKQKLRLRESYIYQPWFVNKQHAGFSQLYSGLLFLTVKGASHQVPQAKREAAFELFNNTLSGHPEFEILEKELKVDFVQE